MQRRGRVGRNGCSSARRILNQRRFFTRKCLQTEQGSCFGFQGLRGETERQMVVIVLAERGGGPGHPFFGVLLPVSSNGAYGHTGALVGLPDGRPNEQPINGRLHRTRNTPTVFNGRPVNPEQDHYSKCRSYGRPQGAVAYSDRFMPCSSTILAQ